MRRFGKVLLAGYAAGVLMAAALLFWQAVNGGALERLPSYDFMDWLLIALLYSVASLSWPVLLVAAVPLFFDLLFTPVANHCCQLPRTHVQQ